MFISPPILLRHNANEHDDHWIERCMSGDAPGRGAYPLSHEMEWHGGLHLTAPRNGIKAEDIRAVSDGKIIFVRQSTKVNTSDENHPLNFHNGWTSDACVVIEHCLEICPGPNGSFTFYSLYHHLADINPDIKPGQQVRRRDPIGHAGRIYGELDRFHFEICCDDANLIKLTGRANGELATEKDGRVDIVFGEIFFVIPAGTPVYENQPVHWRSDGHVQPPKPPGSKTWPDTQAQVALYTAPSTFIIGSRCGQGFGSVPGDAGCTSYRRDGLEFATIVDNGDGAALYRTATQIVDGRDQAKSLELQACPPTKAYHAVVEMLRFGRVIHPDDLTLIPADLPHWRRVRYEGGEGWVNLNAPGVRKFSDADFPHWTGWLFVDDDSAPSDCKCESALIRQLLGTSSTSGARTDDAALDDKTVQAKLKKTICKFPCEWEEAKLEARWSWLRKASAVHPEPYSEQEFGATMAHLKALCFPCPELFAAQWRFEPREFIKLFRRCGWSSVSHRISKSIATGKLPDTTGLSPDLAADMYARMLLETAHYLERSQLLFKIDVGAALEMGEAIEFGLRVPTGPSANGGRGVNDDRMLLLKFNANDEYQLIAETLYTADPAGSYRDGPTRPPYWGVGRGGPTARRQPDTPDANRDGHDDLGRIHEGIYIYSWAYDASKGAAVYTDEKGQAFNVLRPAKKLPSDRYFDDAWHFDETSFNDITDSPYKDRQTMLQHKGYRNFTGSAGCQTFIHSSNSDRSQISFEDFAKKLTSTRQHSFIYVLRTL